MQFITEVYWNSGERQPNQDSLSLQEVSIKGERVVFALVCDGMGGLWSGETASGFVAERMTEWFYKEALPLLEKKKRSRKIECAGIRCLYNCNEEMKEFASKKKIQFGTTVTALLFHKKHYLLWHSGDTRAYQITSRGRNGRIFRLTDDHSANERVLTKCIGSFTWKEPDICRGRFERRNMFLICSDGFRHVVSEEKLMEALSPGQLISKEQISRRIKEIADYSRRQGETDNISAAVITTV